MPEWILYHITGKYEYCSSAIASYWDLYPQYLSQWIEHNRFWFHIFSEGMNDWMSDSLCCGLGKYNLTWLVDWKSIYKIGIQI